MEATLNNNWFFFNRDVTVLAISPFPGDKNVLMSSCEHMTVSNETSSGQKVQPVK